MTLRVIERRNFYGEDLFFSPTRERVGDLQFYYYHSISEGPPSKCADLGEVTEFRGLTCNNVEDSIEYLASVLNK